MNTFQNEKSKIELFQDLISQLKDHRRINKGNIRHSLQEIFFLTLSATVSGCNTWESIQVFGKEKIDWLRKMYTYKHGIPSHDTLGTFFSAFDTKVFGNFFMQFSQLLAQTDSQLIAIDGKTVRGAASNKDGILHILSAFCHKNRLTIGQELVGEKSNEITAIPRLLDLLDITNCTVTIDAMGCQKAIAEKIIEKKANYILQVKDNQKGLKQQIEKLFATQKIKEEAITRDSDHGRMEKRTCRVIDNLTFLDESTEWKGLKTIIQIKSEIYQKNTQKPSESTRLYISSSNDDAKMMMNNIRNHWSIENNLHWNLDVIFNEDFQLKKKGNSSINFNMISKIALAMLEAEKTKKISKPLKRFIAAMNDDYREKILGF